MALTQEDLSFQLGFDIDNTFAKELEAIGKKIKVNWDFVGKTLDKVAQSMKADVVKAKELQIASTPTLIKEKVKHQLELNKAQEQYNKALEKEMGRQRGFIGNIKAALPKGITGQVIASAIGGGFGGGFGGALGGGAGALAGGKGVGGVVGAAIGAGTGGGVGGAVGAAAGGALALAGPAGLAIGAAAAGVALFSKAVGKIAGGVLNTVNRGLSSMSRYLQEMSGPLGPIGAGLAMVTDGLESLGSVLKAIPIVGDLFGPILDAFTALPSIFGNLLTTLTQFSSLASPGQYKQWTMALEDAQAVIGRAFLPVLTKLTDVVRFLGDILATILPSIDEVTYALQPLQDAWDELRAALKGFFEEHGPLIRNILVAGLRAVAQAIAAVVKAIKPFIEWLGKMLDSLFPGFTGESEAMKSARGVTARPAQLQGLEEYQRSLQLSAYSQGAQTEPQKQTSILQGIQAIQDKILEELQNLWDKVWDTIGPYWEKIVEITTSVWDVLSTIWEVLSSIYDYIKTALEAISAAFKNLGGIIGDAFVKALRAIFGDQKFADYFSTDNTGYNIPPPQQAAAAVAASQAGLAGHDPHAAGLAARGG